MHPGPQSSKKRGREANSTETIFSQPFIIPAILIFFAAAPLLLGLIPRNRYYGVRTERTLASDEFWFPVNKFGGGVLILAAACYFVIAVAFPTPPPPHDGFSIWLIHLTGFLVPLFFGFALIRKYAGCII